MKLQSLSPLLLAAGLLQAAFAGRLSDVSQRKGFSPKLKRAPNAPRQDGYGNKTDSFRFYSETSARVYYQLYCSQSH